VVGKTAPVETGGSFRIPNFNMLLSIHTRNSQFLHGFRPHWMLGGTRLAQAPLLQAQGIKKRLGSVVALRMVNLELAAGEVHAIVGDNGAGKSTFIKILSGVIQQDAGDIKIDGQAVSMRSPHEAREVGIETVYQDLALAGPLDAAANLYLGREVLLPPPLRWR